MKLVFHNYATIKLMENSCVKFSNEKSNSLQRYDISQNYRIMHIVDQAFIPT
jgi:hypothetical protein